MTVGIFCGTYLEKWRSYPVQYSWKLWFVWQLHVWSVVHMWWTEDHMESSIHGNCDLCDNYEYEVWYVCVWHLMPCDTTSMNYEQRIARYLLLGLSIVSLKIQGSPSVSHQNHIFSLHWRGHIWLIRAACSLEQLDIDINVNIFVSLDSPKYSYLILDSLYYPIFLTLPKQG